MQYEIIAESRPADWTEESGFGADEVLEEKVASYIADGWRPQGGVSTATQGDLVWCFQAMVKD